ncbi:rhodanese-like domain-containing protein [Nonlabens ponticola]|uniref:Rhodanese-like domain-containing protein n=1 Tax=Nonlabens ponticola TaxID=2496866 RepID=A0A3S9MWM1_9FLAO|nr:rhodanese-like domain-containing protein [Nonlabens ponticola]AZQ43542.1 rhodanese-like domain-containing protein [Nonlabens ponticola]
MRSLLVLTVMLICSAFAKAQSIKSVLEKYNQHSVPYITVQEVKMDYENYVILDTRKKEEFEVSHLPGAYWVDANFDQNNLPKSLRDNPKKLVIVYCTIGVRSEDFGERLVEAGYKNVRNLYGSIFSWKDAGYELVDDLGQPTDSVHTYSKTWSKYLKTGIPIN